MKIKVLLFSRLREIFGSGEVCLELEKGSTVDEAAKTLFSGTNTSAVSGLSIRYAVNGDFQRPEEVLKEGDVLAILLPMAGG